MKKITMMLMAIAFAITANAQYYVGSSIVYVKGLLWQHDYNVSQSVWGDTGIIDFLNRLLWQPQNAATK